ncbi:MAG TPA: hypothetical protein VLI46_15335 [Ramlibacter sp.]|nr:hypothetical protein [Ramlibacter sp.]
MKPALALLLAAFALSTSAQTLAPLPQDKPKGTPIASPNRTASSELAASSSKKSGPASPTLGTSSAPVYIDATGKAWGRAEGAATALLHLNGKLTRVGGFDYDCTIDPGTNECTSVRSGGYTWSRQQAVYYPTADCSGQGWGPVSPGVAQYAFPVLDASDDQLYLYLVDPAQIEFRRQFQSLYLNRQCSYFGPVYLSFLAPIAGAVLASGVATPPFYVK